MNNNSIKEMSAKAIKDMMKLVIEDDYHKYIDVLKTDNRKAVQTIGAQYQKKIDDHLNEVKRIKSLWDFEQPLCEGYELVAGIDEVGRGPLAGAVVAAAVILPKNIEILGVNDSKKLSEEKREELFKIITEKAISIGVGIVDEKEIDEINILNATKKAMKIAIEQLEPKPDMLLIDAVVLADIDIKQESIIKGDAKSISIAASSIIAKVTRDKMIKEYDKTYPEYGFASHKGYGTKQHIEAIKKYGPLEVHRKTFIKAFI